MEGVGYRSISWFPRLMSSESLMVARNFVDALAVTAVMKPHFLIAKLGIMTQYGTM